MSVPDFGESFLWFRPLPAGKGEPHAFALEELIAIVV